MNEKTQDIISLLKEELDRFAAEEATALREQIAIERRKRMKVAGKPEGDPKIRTKLGQLQETLTDRPCK